MNSRNASLEGVRGVAACLVFFVHYDALFGYLHQPGTASTLLALTLKSVGYAGVDLFFLLSGLLIYGTLVSKPRSYRTFLGRRVQRIYPTFVTILGLYIALSFVFPQESRIPGSPGAAILYVAANLLLLPGIFPITPIVTVAWSLSYEFLFYLTVPILIAVLGLTRWPRRRRIGLLLVTMVAGAAAYLIVRNYVQVLMFVAGAAVYELAEEPWSPRVLKWAQAAAVIVLLATVPVLYAVEIRPDFGQQLFGAGTRIPQLIRTMLLAVGFSCLVFSCAVPGTAAARRFAVPAFTAFGRFSYSYYLVHGLAIKAAARAFTAAGLHQLPHPDVVYWLTMGPVFGATIVAATVLFIAIERRFSLRESSTEAPATVSTSPGLLAASVQRPAVS